MHLLIPYAACASPASREALASLQLPHLSGLLARLSPSGRLAHDPDAPLPLVLPHERLHARALGLPDAPGLTPWAAHAARQRGLAPDQPWAWFTPCHWQAGMDTVVMNDPAQLALTEPESRALLAAMAPYLSEDGLHLELVTPTLWLVRGEPLRDLACPSLDRVIGQNLRTWQPSGPGARTLRRLHSEMQMLLYTHPVNDERTARRLPPVNAFWVHGAGVLPPALSPDPLPLRQPLALRRPALDGDARAWADAWARIDAEDCAALAAALAQGQDVRLSLCSELSAQTWTPQPRSLWTRLTRRAPSAASALLALL